MWQQGNLVEVVIEDVNHDGAGVGRVEGRVVFVPATVPGDRVLARLVRVKPTFASGKLHELLQSSPHRVRPSCIVADKCGGCQWQQIDYAYQLAAKHNLVQQDLERIGGFINPAVDAVLGQHSPLAYRNKSTYPMRRSQTGQVQAGYYQTGSHQLINLNQCPIQDQRLNPLLAEIKQDIQKQGWGIYDEEKHRGKLRHLGLRIGRRTGEMLLTLVSKEKSLPGLETQAQEWLERYPSLVGVALNINAEQTNAIFGSETIAVAGQTTLREEFAGLQFDIHPTTFFQINTEQAEALLEVILNELNLQGQEQVLDAYCGIGTLTLPLAQRANRVVGLEVQPDAIAQATHNASLNQIDNVKFYVGAVEEILLTLAMQPDVVLLDPPRRGCAPKVLESLLTMQNHRLVYVSCNPSTLARDLKILCQSGHYQLTRVQPVDFFPQTAHVEAVAFLTRITDEESGENG